MKHVIIGNGVAGHTAAETIREDSPEAAIDIFTTEETPFYDRIGLRDYIRQGRSAGDLVFNDVGWYDANDIDIHMNTAITSIDRERNEIVTGAGETYPYDRLLLAVGGTPRTLPMEKGVDHVHHLWTLDHGRSLRQDLEQRDDGVVIGGGLLGFDLVGSFNEMVDTTYLIREDRWWHSVLTPPGAEIVHDAMRDQGVSLRLEESATDLRNTENGAVMVETGKNTYNAGVVGIAVGHARNTDLAAAAGLETGVGIYCDECLQTEDEQIYVAGDAAEYTDVVLGSRHISGSWVAAQTQGEVAGRNMTGEEEPLRFVDTYTVNHFGLNVASLGDPLNGADRDVVTAVDREAGVYRKIVIDGGRIVGAAIIGEMRWMHPVKQLIRSEKDVSDSVDRFSDPEFTPSSLVEE